MKSAESAQAAKAYRRFMEEGKKLGHDERYYQAVDQRFLGDEKFIQKIVGRVPQAEIRPGGRKLRFEKLLNAVAKVHGTESKTSLRRDGSARGQNRGRNLRIWRANGAA